LVVLATLRVTLSCDAAVVVLTTAMIRKTSRYFVGTQDTAV
jgi:hypothetical protein